MGYMHMAFLGQESLWSAAASECAAEQGEFWTFHDYLFEEWNNAERGDFNKKSLKQLAVDLAYDTAAFTECMDSGRTEAIVFQDTNVARSVGARSTPTFFLNGRQFQGALPFEEFQALIEAELTKNN